MEVSITYHDQRDSLELLLLNSLADLSVYLPLGKPFQSRHRYLSSFRLGHARRRFYILNQNQRKKLAPSVPENVRLSMSSCDDTKCILNNEDRFEVIYQTRETVFHRDIQTPRRF